jgi:SNF2 family DNA or RNA helicase
LTAANHAHILEPWWNLSIENQAADRLHRLGQKRTVHIHRYIMTETIEERMLDLQEEKVRLARTAFREDRQENVSEQRIHDIQTLLGLGRQ